MTVKSVAEPDLDMTAEGADTRLQIKTGRAPDCHMARDY